MGPKVFVNPETAATINIFFFYSTLVEPSTSNMSEQQLYCCMTGSCCARVARLPAFIIPPTKQCFALGANNACLVGENPTCSVPAL